MQGLWVWGQPQGLPCPGLPLGMFVPEVRGWGTLLGTPRDVGLRDSSQGRGLGTPQSYWGTGVWGQGHPDTHLAGDTFKDSSE